MTDLDSTLSAIDAATGCQQCEGPLGNSPSDSFCSDGCQGAWFASRSEPLEMEQHSPEAASVSSYARYWLNRWTEATSASDGQSSVAADAHGGRWHNSSIAVEWADEIHVRNEEVATRYRESLQMVSDHWIDTGLLPAAQSETADDPDPLQRALEARRNRNAGPQRRQRAPRRINPRGTR